MNKNGYLILTLNDKTGERRTRIIGVHRVVGEAFIGPLPPGLHTAHGNGDPSDNRLANLRYCTPLENVHDKFEHGTILAGEQHHAATVTEQQVREIRRAATDGLRPVEIAVKLDVSVHVVRAVVKGITWRHVA